MSGKKKKQQQQHVATRFQQLVCNSHRLFTEAVLIQNYQYAFQNYQYAFQVRTDNGKTHQRDSFIHDEVHQPKKGFYFPSIHQIIQQRNTFIRACSGSFQLDVCFRYYNYRQTFSCQSTPQFPEALSRIVVSNPGSILCYCKPSEELSPDL